MALQALYTGLLLNISTLLAGCLRQVKVWDLAANADEGRDAIAEAESILSLSISRDGTALLLNLANQRIHLWDVCRSPSSHGTLSGPLPAAGALVGGATAPRQKFLNPCQKQSRCASPGLWEELQARSLANGQDTMLMVG